TYFNIAGDQDGPGRIRTYFRPGAVRRFTIPRHSQITDKIHIVAGFQEADNIRAVHTLPETELAEFADSPGRQEFADILLHLLFIVIFIPSREQTDTQTEIYFFIAGVHRAEAHKRRGPFPDISGDVFDHAHRHFRLERIARFQFVQ